MRPTSFFALVALGSACHAGPTPRNAGVPSVPIHNTAAVVENVHTVTEVTPSIAAMAVLAQPDRDPRDRALDARYQGAELLTFFDVQPGMRVAELTAGGGYFTELLARAVGPTGHVVANDPPSLIARTSIGHAIDARVARSINARVEKAMRELGAPLPRAEGGLDLVYLSLPYRTAEALGTDTKKMNRAVFDALGMGGTYIVLDFRPRVAHPGVVDARALHHEESMHVRREVEAAGFSFVTEARFLHNDPNPDEWDAIAAPDPTPLEQQDRFLLEFVKRTPT